MRPCYARRMLACINAMDATIRDFSQSFWVDMGLWSFGAVFLNRVILTHDLRPSTEPQPRPSMFRRAFFLLVGAAFIVLLAAILAGGPFLNFEAQDFHLCRVSRPMLLALVASPVVLFVLQSAFFQGPGRRLFRDRKRGALVSLVLSSLLLATGMGIARDVFVLPNLCERSVQIFPSHAY
ncbi:hypothetical protein [Myxococcus vastator]|uniref:hypothetical protein n=1 Tax=Myxococcus vastator TaxID=2709664 RepID=UPI0013D69EAF|nr:hypothetical protein [Myxococcus vastator]